MRAPHDTRSNSSPPARELLRFPLLRFPLLRGLSLLRRLRHLLAFRPRLGRLFAIACLRPLTFLPDLPLLKVRPCASSSRATLAEAFFEYLRAMAILPVAENNRRRPRKFPTRRAFAYSAAA